MLDQSRHIHSARHWHRKDVQAFQAEAQSGKDPEIKAWAGKTRPTLEEHLKQATSANTEVNRPHNLGK